MKRVAGFTTTKEIVILTIFFSLLADFIFYLIFFGPDRSGNQYTVLRLSSESNPRGNGEDYIYRNGKTVLRYSFETGEVTEYQLEIPEDKWIYSSAIVGNQVYYSLSDDSVRRFDWEMQIDEEVLSREDILRLHGRKDWEGLLYSNHISLGKYGECLVLYLYLNENLKAYVYACPVDGDLKTDIVDVNDLFPKEDKTGREQTIVYRGMRIKRYYNMKIEEYRISSLTEADELVTLHSDHTYSVEGSPTEHEIECLNESAYSFAIIQKKNLTTENGRIIGLLHVPKNARCDRYDPSQKELKYDVLFSLSPETGESSILYKARNNRTRIIGYQDGLIYLLHNYRIYTKEADGGKTELFLKLPRDSGYTFSWQGDYLIVMCHGNIFGTYKVR